VKDVRMLVRINLEKLGLEVDSAENGQIALEKASASKAEGRQYDLILMDIQMPKLDGYEATRHLRQDGWEGPIVALTAHAMAGDRESCLEAGFDDHISKPITGEELLKTIARHLDRATSAQPVPARGSTAAPPGLLASGSIDEDEKAELLAAFLGDLSNQITGIEEALRAGDLETLVELAHKLRGSAGMYGFPEIAEAARVVEKQGAEPTEPTAAVKELVDLCRRANGVTSDGS
jgi:CheY-like chemotaxis protein/HPt (histidine-containing phosphotransfer) domain-containing protein